MQDYKVLIQEFFDIFAFYEMALMGVLFIIFLLFFILGLLLRGRRFFPKFFFVLSFGVFIAGPFILQFCMQYFLYKTDIDIIQSKRLEYVDSFFVQAKITNIGFSPFSLCDVSVNILHQDALSFLNPIYPKNRYKKTIPIHLQPHQSDEFNIIFNEFKQSLPFEYALHIDCHNSNGLIKILQGDTTSLSEEIQAQP